MALSVLPDHRTIFAVLVIAVITAPVSASAEDFQSSRSIALQEIQMVAQAEVLAAGCGLRLNTRLRDMLRNDATIKLTPDALASIEQFARTYTETLLHRHHRGICAHALEEFGLHGRQMEGLLLL
jgi:hypothetical protein